MPGADIAMAQMQVPLPHHLQVAFPTRPRAITRAGCDGRLRFGRPQRLELLDAFEQL